MIKPAIPANEDERLLALNQLGVLDTEAEERFDKLTALAKFAFSVDVVLVSLVDSRRQWFKSAQGLKAARQTARSISFCGHAINQHRVFVVPDASADPRFHDNPLVVGPPYIRFYAGAPLRDSQGHALGTLCLIDTSPRELSTQEASHLRYLATLVERELLHHDWQQTIGDLNTTGPEATDRERLLGAVLDQLPVNIYVKDLQQRKTLANRAEQNFLRASNEDQAPGRNDHEVHAGYDQQLVSADEEDKQVMEQGTSIINQECYALDRSGQESWLRISKYPLRNVHQEIIGLVGVSIDITEQKRAVQSSQRQFSAITQLQEISAEGGLDTDERMRRALRIGMDFLDMNCGTIGLIDEDAYTLLWAQSNEEIELVEFRENETIPLKETYCQLLNENDGELAIERMSQSRYHDHPAYKKLKFESYLGISLSVDDDVFGSLNFFSRTGCQHPLAEGERVILRLLSRWVSTELARNRSQENLDTVMEQVPGMIFQYRLWPDGRDAFVYSSTGIENVYHVSPQSVKKDASVIYERIHPEDVKHVSNTIEASSKALTLWDCEYRVLDRNDKYRWVAGRATPKRTPDGGTIWYGYIHDVDARKKSEQVRSEFVSTVSHELRTPLTAVSATLKLISAGVFGKLTKPMIKMLDRAQRNTQRLGVLIDDLLDLEKLSSGRLRLELSQHSVSKLLRQCVELNRNNADSHGVSLVMSQDTKDYQIVVDTDRFKQLINNLISNAIKVCPEGRSVSIGWRRDNSDIEVWVKDEGAGIPKAFRSQLFDRFTQVDSSDGRFRGGTGLGLAITRELTELMKGQIDFETEEGVGTTFFVRFPISGAKRRSFNKVQDQLED